MAQPGANEGATWAETQSTIAKETNASPNEEPSPSNEPINNDLVQELSNSGMDTLVERDAEKAENTKGTTHGNQEDLVSTAFN